MTTVFEHIRRKLLIRATKENHAAECDFYSWYRWRERGRDYIHLIARYAIQPGDWIPEPVEVVESYHEQNH